MVGFRARDDSKDPLCFALWREAQIVVVRLFGDIDDRGSEAWRKRLTAEIDLRGAPRFVAFDMFEANPKNSMSTRFQVAGYCRDLMKRVEWAVILMPSSVSGTVVVRIVSRIVATSRVSMVTSRAAYQKALDAMRKGDRPGL